MARANSSAGTQEIQRMIATTLPDSRPKSAAQFVERLFGELPRFFKDEDELRKIWSASATRKSLLQQLSEAGFGRDQLAESPQQLSHRHPPRDASPTRLDASRMLKIQVAPSYMSDPNCLPISTIEVGRHRTNRMEVGHATGHDEG